MTETLIQEITGRFKAEAEPGYREHVAKLFNLNVDGYYGVRLPVIRKIAREYYHMIKPLDTEEKLTLCGKLLRQRKYEFKVTAYQWAGQSKNEFKPQHLQIFEIWLDENTSDWADCDDICNQVLGEFFLRFPKESTYCVDWAGHRSLWFRRAAAVSLIKPLRKGNLQNRAFQIADLLLEDSEDMVQKGYGWMLKEASKKFPGEVWKFVISNADKMPRTAYRYALEKFPEDKRKYALSLGK